jgi:HAD superfamily hydrolase (TIGR01490 family)
LNLALFDFDGTITTIGTYPAFVRFAIRRRRKVVGSVILAPLLIGYRLTMVSDPAIRKAISRVAFWREDPSRLYRLGEQYAREALPDVVRSEAMERIAWHKERGDRVVVVSAGLDFYLGPWCRALGVDLICSQIETRDGRFTGRYAPADCCGIEKARRIRERFSLADYATVYAYGDSGEDQDMLALAHRRYFRWTEVQ